MTTTYGATQNEEVQPRHAATLRKVNTAGGDATTTKASVVGNAITVHNAITTDRAGMKDDATASRNTSCTRGARPERVAGRLINAVRGGMRSLQRGDNDPTDLAYAMRADTLLGCGR